MRVTSILLTGVFALVANAQSTTNPSPPTTTDPAAAEQSSAQAAMIACIEACEAGDVDCTSRCIAVPNPDDAQVNETNNCVAACDQGEGTEADILAYGQCVTGCINEHYFTGTAGVPQPTGGAGSGGNNNDDGENDDTDGGDGDDGNGTDPTETSGEQSSPTETGAPQDSSNAASHMMSVAGPAAGLFGFLAAVLAL
ncbi:hypothetical protein MFIFM68171_00665 [Madurella fahalii]|uniref:Uncharacterized protein n=1 Tax=Madurella fahalii TaxID=1157608 RepID=A0ABQ0FYR1_9PEZI